MRSSWKTTFGLSWMAGMALVTAAALALGAAFFAPRMAVQDHPNVILIVADDLGFMDITPNSPATFHETPNLARLARMGMRFTNGYAAAPVCSPTRACLLTGKHPARLGMTDVILTGMNRAEALLPAATRTHLDEHEITLAEAFREVGYEVFISGKWHLGAGEVAIPASHGFDSGLVHDRQMVYPHGSEKPPHDRDPKMSERISADAIRFIQAAGQRPFFAYLPFPAPHLPLEAPQALVEKYREKLQVVTNPQPSTANPVYAAMIEQFDRAIGQILDAIDDDATSRRTIIVVTSDNGGLEHFSTSNAPLRAGKGTLYEGGIRVPWIIVAPGVASPGSTTDAPVSTADLYPTLLDLAGLRLRPMQHGDGISLVPTLRGEAGTERSLFWHFPHYSVASPAGAIRCGDWKLIEWFESGKTELFDLRNDAAESVDLAEAKPERAGSLRASLAAWRDSVGARMPAVNLAWVGNEGD